MITQAMITLYIKGMFKKFLNNTWNSPNKKKKKNVKETKMLQKRARKLLKKKLKIKSFPKCPL
jgi:hypothetical protein